MSITSNLDHRRAIRTAELRNILPAIDKRGRLLEIGAGPGWQAKVLAEVGFDVVAIDVNLPHYQIFREQRVWPVQEYDGMTIPYPDRSFDIVFTSNTLPHIEGLSRTLGECRRVLKDDGVAIHILPTVSWRIWTTAAHFVNLRLLARAWNLLGQKTAALGTGKSSEQRLQFESDGKKAVSLICRILPRRLGERGNVLSEIYLFSERKWKAIFRFFGDLRGLNYDIAGRRSSLPQ